MDELIIEANGSERQHWRDFWPYRESFMFLDGRDLLVRYQQTVVGVFWFLTRPVPAGREEPNPGRQAGASPKNPGTLRFSVPSCQWKDIA